MGVVFFVMSCGRCMLLSLLHPVAVLNGAICMICRFCVFVIEVYSRRGLMSTYVTMVDVCFWVAWLCLSVVPDCSCIPDVHFFAADIAYLSFARVLLVLGLTRHHLL